MICISLGLLKSSEAAQKGAKKKGIFLQNAGRMLDPYLPEQMRTSSIHVVTNNCADLTRCVHAALTNDHSWDVNDLMSDGGACPQQAQATIRLPARQKVRGLTKAQT